MNTYLIERELPRTAAHTDDELQSVAQAYAEVLRDAGIEVHSAQSYVAGDRIHCVYVAQCSRSLHLQDVHGTRVQQLTGRESSSDRDALTPPDESHSDRAGSAAARARTFRPTIWRPL